MYQGGRSSSLISCSFVIGEGSLGPWESGGMLPFERVHYLMYEHWRWISIDNVNARCVYPATLVAERGPVPALLLDDQG